jgi:putative hydrolase of the HAD superfamily
MELSTPKLLISLDAVGTLIRPMEPVATVYSRAARSCGLEIDPAVIASRFRQAFQNQEAFDLQHSLRTSEARERQRWRSIVAEVFAGANDPTAPLPWLWDYYSKPEAWDYYPDAAELLAGLSEVGTDFAIASNLDSRLRRVVEGLPLLRNCKVLHISGEVGWRKPAAEFFAGLAERSGRQPPYILHIGDDWQNDYQGALRAGFRAAWLNRSAAASGEGVLRSLDDLPRLIPEELAKQRN